MNTYKAWYVVRKDDEENEGEKCFPTKAEAEKWLVDWILMDVDNWAKETRWIEENGEEIDGQVFRHQVMHLYHTGHYAELIALYNIDFLDDEGTYCGIEEIDVEK